MVEYRNIRDFFDQLNAKHIVYLVLRNYENLLEPDMYVDGHGDVDLLCRDSKEIIRIVSPFEEGDGIHYCISVCGKRVSIDLRTVGDGYYCYEWEQAMLNSRVPHECFYVMDETNHFYSLVYHAILQKRSFSDEYQKRLTRMAMEAHLPVSSNSEQGFLLALEEFMRTKKYQFTYSHDRMVPNRFNLIDKSMISNDFKLRSQHQLFEFKISIIESLVRIKHFILGQPA